MVGIVVCKMVQLAAMFGQMQHRVTEAFLVDIDTLGL